MGEQSFLAKTPAYHHDVHAPPIRISLSFPPLQPLRPHGYSLLDNANIKTFSGPCKCEYPFYPPRVRNRPILRLFDQYFISPLFIHPPGFGLSHSRLRPHRHSPFQYPYHRHAATSGGLRAFFTLDIFIFGFISLHLHRLSSLRREWATAISPPPFRSSCGNLYTLLTSRHHI